MRPGTLERLMTNLTGEPMAASPYRYGMFLIGVLIAWGWPMIEPPILCASSAKVTQAAKQPKFQPSAAERQAPATRQKARVGKPARDESNKRMIPEPRAKSSPTSKKSRRLQKAGKKLPPPSIGQPKPDLSYHGIFEQPQRYDPHRDRRRGRAPDPQAEELQHDHFQELDKNRDGMIDPVERAFGRLDLDRDLNTRQRE